MMFMYPLRNANQSEKKLRRPRKQTVLTRPFFSSFVLLLLVILRATSLFLRPRPLSQQHSTPKTTSIKPHSQKQKTAHPLPQGGRAPAPQAARQGQGAGGHGEERREWEKDSDFLFSSSSFSFFFSRSLLANKTPLSLSFFLSQRNEQQQRTDRRPRGRRSAGLGDLGGQGKERGFQLERERERSEEKKERKKKPEKETLASSFFFICSLLFSSFLLFSSPNKQKTNRRSWASIA
jgi:hypothetical protein